MSNSPPVLGNRNAVIPEVVQQLKAKWIPNSLYGLYTSDARLFKSVKEQLFATKTTLTCQSKLPCYDTTVSSGKVVYDPQKVMMNDFSIDITTNSWTYSSTSYTCPSTGDEKCPNLVVLELKDLHMLNVRGKKIAPNNCDDFNCNIWSVVQASEQSRIAKIRYKCSNELVPNRHITNFFENGDYCKGLQDSGAVLKEGFAIGGTMILACLTEAQKHEFDGNDQDLLEGAPPLNKECDHRLKGETSIMKPCAACGDTEPKTEVSYRVSDYYSIFRFAGTGNAMESCDKECNKCCINCCVRSGTKRRSTTVGNKQSFPVANTKKQDKEDKRQKASKNVGLEG